LFLFWHGGNQSQTSLYFNVNIARLANGTPDANNGAFLAQYWTHDQKLLTPEGLVWQSDPTAIYRTVQDPNNPPTIIEALDVAYTGVLKNRQKVETFLTRYRINRDELTKATPDMSKVLQPIPLTI